MAPIQHWESTSGAQVYFLQLKELPMVDVRVLFDAGSAREGKLPAGSATLTATLVGEGSGGRSAGEISAEFEKYGAEFGIDVNRQYSKFSLRSLSDPAQLEPVLKNFAEVLAAPDFPPEAFTREHKRLLVSIHGRRQSPEAISHEAFAKAVFAGHPYASPVGGDEAGVQAIQLRQLRDFHQKHYTLKNMIVVLAGDLDQEQAERIAEQISHRLPQGATLPNLPRVPDLKKAKEICIPYPSQQAHILIGQPGIDRDNPDYHTLFTGNHMLGGGGMVSRLFERIREQRGLAYSVSSYFQPLRGRGLFLIGMQTEAKQGKEALRLLREELANFLQEGPDAKELEAAKNNLVGGFPLRIDSNSELANYLGVIAFNKLPLDYLEQFPKRVATVTTGQIRKAFQKTLDPERMVTVLLGPWEQEASSAPCTPP